MRELAKVAKHIEDAKATLKHGTPAYEHLDVAEAILQNVAIFTDLGSSDSELTDVA